MKPTIKIIDIAFNYRGIISGYTSLQLERKVAEAGNFELHVPADIECSSELQPNLILSFGNHAAGIVEKVQKKYTSSGVEIIATGKELKSIVSRRLTVPDERDDSHFYGWDRFPDLEEPDAPAESIIKYYARKHCSTGNPYVLGSRAFQNLEIAEDLSRGIDLRWQSRFETLETVFKGIWESSGIGYDIKIDLNNKIFIFDIINNTNKTKNSENPVIFSDKLKVIDNFVYTQDVSKYKNTGYAGGKGEDEERFIQVFYTNDIRFSGWGRLETWIDCGSIEEYEDLKFEAQYKMKDMIEVQNCTAEVSKNETFVYLRDWDLGDFVTLQCVNVGVEQNLQIVEIKESYEGLNENIRITLGKQSKNILDEIRRTVTVR